jgi:hypothetical protein
MLSEGRFGVDKVPSDVLNCDYCPEHVPFMAQDEDSKNQNEVTIKFLVPRRLKRELKERALERNLALSAFLRLITTEYVKRTIET